MAQRSDSSSETSPDASSCFSEKPNPVVVVIDPPPSASSSPLSASSASSVSASSVSASSPDMMISSSLPCSMASVVSSSSSSSSSAASSALTGSSGPSSDGLLLLQIPPSPLTLSPTNSVEPLPLLSISASSPSPSPSSPSQSSSATTTATTAAASANPNPNLTKSSNKDPYILSTQEILADPAMAEEQPTPLKKSAANRCHSCRKRVGLLGFRCKCGDVFCATHRYSDRHDCSYDYKAAARLAIAKGNPLVKAAKIVKI